VQIPAFCVEYTGGEAQTTIFPITHGAFSEDTVLLGSVSKTTGDLHLIGARFHPTNASSQVTGTAVVSADVAVIIQQVGSLDFSPSLRIGALRQSPLSAGSAHSLVLVTNIGIVILELPVTSAKLPGARHVHFGAGLGSLGKSILYVQESSVIYGSLDVLVGNPTGKMEAKNTVTVYESPAAHNLPLELQKRPFRSAPIFMPSPSGLFLCLLWPMEFRYEIFHTASLLSKVGTRSGGGSTQRSPVVSSGDSVADFGWIGDDDVYAVLRAADFVEQATAFMVTAASMEGASGDDGTGPPIRVSVKSVANLAQSVTKSATSATFAVTKSATSATIAVTKSATTATLGLASGTLAATKSATKAAVNTTKKGMKRSMGLFGKKKKKADDGGLSSMEAESQAETEDMSEAAESNDPTTMAPIPIDMDPSNQNRLGGNTKKRSIELRKLDLVESNASALGASIAAATSSSMGDVVLRGGNRNIPTAVFGGPVLCVGSRTEEDPEGSAHFYAKKTGSNGDRADEYVSTGPTLPYPDLVVWDDDGSLCAVTVSDRVAIYALDGSAFVLLGTVRITNPSNNIGPIYSAKFLHGVLYCCSSGSVHCVFIGESADVTRLECYELASIDAEVAGPIAPLQQYKSFMPPKLPLPLVLPSVLGYQSGSLVVSTVRGLHAVPLTHPLLRIGALLSAGQTDAAQKWFDAVPTYECEALSGFVERRGFPDLAMTVKGVSIERVVDLSMRHGYIGQLEEIVETYGVRGLRSIDAGRGLSPSLFGEHGGSVVVSVAAYLLAHGRVELARRMATECLRSGEEGRREALLVASLLLSVDEHDASRLVARAVEDVGMDWPVAQFIRHYVLSERT